MCVSLGPHSTSYLNWQLYNAVFNPFKQKVYTEMCWFEGLAPVLVPNDKQGAR